MRSQDRAVSRLSPPLITHSLARLAICSSQSHPGFCRRNRNHPGGGQRVTTITRSDHPTATGETAPSVTPTPKSPHANVWYGDVPVLQSPGDRYDDTSASLIFHARLGQKGEFPPWYKVQPDPPPRAPANGRPRFPFGFLGAGGRLPKARRGRFLICAIRHHRGLKCKSKRSDAGANWKWVVSRCPGGHVQN